MSISFWVKCSSFRHFVFDFFEQGWLDELIDDAVSEGLAGSVGGVQLVDVGGGVKEAIGKGGRDVG
jgi:hypothetical protein